MVKIDAFFNLMDETGASDLHLVAGSQPILRVSGELERVKYDPLDSDELKAMLYEIAPEFKVKIFEETGDVDFGYEIPGVARYRANFFNQKERGCGRFQADSIHRPDSRTVGAPPDSYEVRDAPQGADTGHRTHG